MSRIEEIAEESGMTQYVAAHNKFLERFAQMLIDEICNIKGVECSEVVDKIREHFK